MSFGAVLGGALQGIGAGLSQQIQTKATADAADVLSRRNIALENLKSQNTQAEQVSGGVITRQNQENQGAITAKEGLLKDNRAALKDEQNDGRTLVREKEMARIKLVNDQVLAKGAHGYKVSEQASEAALKFQNDVALSGQEAGETRVGTDGAMVIYSKTGKEIARSIPGLYIPDGTKPKAGGGSILEQAREGDDTTPAPTAKPAAPPKAAPPTKSSTGKTYTMAEAQATATARGISLAEVQRVMSTSGYKLSNK